MDILLAAAELAPYVVDTPAAEAVAALAKTLQQSGHRVTVVAPRLPGYEARGLMVARRLTPLKLAGGGEGFVLDGQLPSGVAISLLDLPGWGDRDRLFGDGTLDLDEVASLIGSFGAGVAAFVAQRQEQGQAFEVVHLHDLPCATAAAQLSRQTELPVATLFTIHDATRQGSIAAKTAEALRLAPEVTAEPGARAGARVSLWRLAVVYADVITTTTALQGDDAISRGTGVWDVAREHGKSLVAIPNGVDYALFNPATDATLPTRYDAEESTAKAVCKTALVRERGLDGDLSRPVLAIVGELSQKGGFDPVVRALPALLEEDLVVLIAGQGTASMMKRLESLQRRHASQLCLLGECTGASYRQLMAGADLCLVPARSEAHRPQVPVALRYGALPIARSGGGIEELVVPCDGALLSGTGWLFASDDSVDLLGAVQRALGAFRSEGWVSVRRRAMRLDLGWDRPARRYHQLYRQAITAHG